MEGVQRPALFLPDGAILIPGVLDSTSNFVEHTELVADRIIRYAELVGRENVIASGDCGFSTAARAQSTVHPSVTWAKLQAVADGARLHLADTAFAALITVSCMSYCYRTSPYASP
jgi:methionine synthase II (cobalamin-independent)